jgi:hypothetical protein
MSDQAMFEWTDQDQDVGRFLGREQMREEQQEAPDDAIGMIEIVPHRDLAGAVYVREDDAYGLIAAMSEALRHE